MQIHTLVGKLNVKMMIWGQKKEKIKTNIIKLIKFINLNKVTLVLLFFWGLTCELLSHE